MGARDKLKELIGPGPNLKAYSLLAPVEDSQLKERLKGISIDIDNLEDCNKIIDILPYRAIVNNKRFLNYKQLSNEQRLLRDTVVNFNTDNIVLSLIGGIALNGLQSTNGKLSIINQLTHNHVKILLLCWCASKINNKTFTKKDLILFKTMKAKSLEIYVLELVSLGMITYIDNETYYKYTGKFAKNKNNYVFTRLGSDTIAKILDVYLTEIEKLIKNKWTIESINKLIQH